MSVKYTKIRFSHYRKKIEAPDQMSGNSQAPIFIRAAKKLAKIQLSAPLGYAKVQDADFW
jgi:hypothetical protein